MKFTGGGKLHAQTTRIYINVDGIIRTIWKIDKTVGSYRLCCCIKEFREQDFDIKNIKLLRCALFTMPATKLDHGNVQGGKAWGHVKGQQAQLLDDINTEVSDSGDYKDVEDLDDKLQSYKGKFIEYDLDNSGDLDVTDVSKMMEKLGQPKNILQIKKIIAEIDLDGTGTVSYREFLRMMLGNKSSIMKIILMFEEKNKEKEKPHGPPPKKVLSDLP